MVYATGRVATCSHQQSVSFEDARPWTSIRGVANYWMPDAISIAFSIAFGRVVQRRREAIGLSQEPLALAAGLDRCFVSRVELGKVRLGMGAAKKFAAAFGVSLHQLVAESEAAMGKG